MVASGLHQKHTKRHTEEIANLAIDLLDRVQQIQVKQAFGEKVKLKIGINTGMCKTTLKHFINRHLKESTI
jgi:hypothetical protein